MKSGHDRQTAHKLRDKAIFQEVLCLHMTQHFSYPHLLLTLDIRTKSDRRFAKPVFDGVLKTDECAAADKQDVCGVNLDNFLVSGDSLDPPLWTDSRFFDDLEQRLLD